MGIYPSCMALDSEKKTVQLVRSDGDVRIFHKSVTAGQIIKEFPQHLVCHSGSFYIGQKTPALSEEDELKVGNKYFLLPHQFFQCELTLLSIASSISPSSTPNSTGGLSGPLRSVERASALCQPFEVENSNVGGGRRIRLSPDFITKIMEDTRLKADKQRDTLSRDSAGDDRGVCNTPELKKQYEQLVTYSRVQCRRPKLETIREEENKINCSCFY